MYRAPKGLVHAVDPGELTVVPLPDNMIHWKDKVENVLDGIREKGYLLRRIKWYAIKIELYS
jgi:hypothetical protein